MNTSTKNLVERAQGGKKRRDGVAETRVFEIIALK
jgi:hypothetical protein